MTKHKQVKEVLSILILLVLISACNRAGSGDQNPENLYDYDVEERIAELGLVLRTPGPPVANYENAVRAGDLIFMAGKGPLSSEGNFITGKMGSELTLDEGYEAARLAAIEQLSALKAEIGDLMVEVFGERGKHARAAVGMSSLPRDFAVEVEMIVQVSK